MDGILDENCNGAEGIVQNDAVVSMQSIVIYEGSLRKQSDSNAGKANSRNRNRN